MFCKYFLDHHEAHDSWAMKFFKSEKNHFFKQMSKEFNLKAFSGLILIRISITLQLDPNPKRVFA